MTLADAGTDLFTRKGRGKAPSLFCNSIISRRLITSVKVFLFHQQFKNIFSYNLVSIFVYMD